MRVFKSWHDGHIEKGQNKVERGIISTKKARGDGPEC